MHTECGPSHTEGMGDSKNDSMVLDTHSMFHTEGMGDEYIATLTVQYCADRVQALSDRRNGG